MVGGDGAREKGSCDSYAGGLIVVVVVVVEAKASINVEDERLVSE